MKSLLAAVLVCLPLLSMAAEEHENYKIQLDWNDKRTLSDNVVQMCDDTYYPGIEVTVPGKAGSDFIVAMDVDITSGKVSTGCTVKRTVKRDSVTYLFDATSSCTVRVFQLKGKPGESLKTATYDFSDAC